MFTTRVKNESVFRHLFKVAEQVTDCPENRHAAAIVYKKQIISIGENQLKTHPMQMKFQTNEKKVHLHAEIDAIVKAINLYGDDFLKRCDLYVMRLTKAGNVGLSKPCKGCQKAIDAFGIKRVYWT